MFTGVGLPPRGGARMAGTSRMSREAHVRICGGLEVKFLRSTRPAKSGRPMSHIVLRYWSILVSGRSRLGAEVPAPQPSEVRSMARLVAFFVLVLLSQVLPGGLLAAAKEAPAEKYRVGDVRQSNEETVPLDASDLRDITAQVMAKHPLLSSSPGIKDAEAITMDRWSEDIAFVIYYPHSENAGIKQAFQVECARQASLKAWICEDATIRRYLALDTQDYEVRVRGSISSDAAIGLIEATRKVLPLVADDGIAVPDTVMQIFSDDDSATVVWVSFEGRSRLLMKGHLAEGGDPTQPDDWIVNRFDREQLGY